MLIGNAGTRKSSAIKQIKKLLIASGYLTIAAERTTKEKFLYDLAHKSHALDDPKDGGILDELFDSLDEPSDDDVTPMFIAADEANDFFGIGNTEFLSILGSLWDWSGKYENRTKTVKSDWIPNPTITILSGNTPTGFSQAFPSSVLGQGFLSRLLLVYGEPNGKRITIPRTPDVKETEHIVNLLRAVKQSGVGLRSFGGSALSLLDKIYQTQPANDDTRFESYSNRRLIHLIKICLAVSAGRLESNISEQSVIQANTYLSYIEQLMPKAMGEFGKAKNADVSHKILTYIANQWSPVTMKDIFKQVSGDLEKMSDLAAIIQKLTFADKIQVVVAKGHSGFLAVRQQEVVEIDVEREGLVSYDTYLTQEELSVLKS